MTVALCPVLIYNKLSWSVIWKFKRKYHTETVPEIFQKGYTTVCYCDGSGVQYTVDPGRARRSTWPHMYFSRSQSQWLHCTTCSPSKEELPEKHRVYCDTPGWYLYRIKKLMPYCNRILRKKIRIFDGWKSDHGARHDRKKPQRYLSGTERRCRPSTFNQAQLRSATRLRIIEKTRGPRAAKALYQFLALNSK
jgi:hypothetical protein